MIAWITHKPRKDGKHKVVIGFSNGKRFTKIYTAKQIEDLIKNKSKTDEVHYI